MKRKDLSDYNSLKNQQKQSSVLKRYKKVLKPKPSNLQNYYSYLTNKKPLLDELNYLSNIQVANAKNEVAKQLENATILNDKFKLKLEEDKKRTEEESKQRKARQEEIFKKELFDANTRQEDEKKKEALNKLSNAFKSAPIRKNFSNIIGEKRFNEDIKLREERKVKAAEVLKKINLNNPYELERKELQKKEAVKKLSNIFKKAPIERKYKEDLIKSRYDEEIKKIEERKAKPKVEVKSKAEIKIKAEPRPRIKTAEQIRLAEEVKALKKSFLDKPINKK